MYFRDPVMNINEIVAATLGIDVLAELDWP